MVRVHRCRPGLLLWVVTACLLPFLSAGPLALLLGCTLVLTTGYRVARWALPRDALARIPVSWLAACVEISVLADVLSLKHRLNACRWWLALLLLTDGLAALCLLRFTLPCRDFGGQARVWLRSLRAAPLYIQVFLLIFLALFLSNLVVAGLSGITVFDSVCVYVPHCIDFLQRGSLTFPVPVQYAPLMFGWFRVWMFTMALGDTLVLLNVLGWISTAAALLTCVLLCRDLGLPRALATAASVAVCSVPLVVCQAANTNYDQHVGFCLAATALFLFRAIRRPNVRDVLLAVLAQLALAIAKGTSVYLAPAVCLADLVLVYRCVAWRRFRPAIVLVGVGFVGSLIVLGPHTVRVRATGINYAPPLGGQSFQQILIDRAYRVAARSVQALLPYELCFYSARSGIGQPGPDFAVMFRSAFSRLGTLGAPPSEPPFADQVTQHLLYPYDSDRAWFGALPLLLAAVAGLGVLLAPRKVLGRFRQRRCLVVLALLGFMGVFQAGYALSFLLDPYNGRYLLIVWFLTAPILGVLLHCLPVTVRHGALILILAAASFEHFAWLNHRAEKPLDRVLNSSRLEHFAARKETGASRFLEVKQLLDRHDVQTVYTDSTYDFRMLFYDDARRRRFVFECPLCPAPGKVFWTGGRLLSDPLQVPDDLNYEIHQFPDLLSQDRGHFLLIPRDWGALLEGGYGKEKYLPLGETKVEWLKEDFGFTIVDVPRAARVEFCLTIASFGSPRRLKLTNNGHPCGEPVLIRNVIWESGFEEVRWTVSLERGTNCLRFQTDSAPQKLPDPDVRRVAFFLVGDPRVKVLK